MNCAGANLVPCRGSVQASDQYILLASTFCANKQLRSDKGRKKVVAFPKSYSVPRKMTIHPQFVNISPEVSALRYEMGADLAMSREKRGGQSCPGRLIVWPGHPL